MVAVGVRELRQNASAVLSRVADGATVDITNHGRVVAQLVPAGEGASLTRDELVAAGAIRPGRGNPLDVTPVVLAPGQATLSDALAGDRASA